MKTLITNARVITPRERIDGGWILVEGARIAALGAGPPPASDQRIDAAERFAAPGFIDLHVQGFRGIDLWDPSEEAFRECVRRMASSGVTACQASVEPTEEVCRTMRPRVGAFLGGSRVLGLYFESPFISAARRGAIPLRRVEPPSPDLARRMIEWSRGLISMITIAPEVDGALAVAPLFRATPNPWGRPVVTAIGHTAATYEQALAGIDAGLKHCTHLYNAMTSLGHREPGVVGALLARPDVTVEVIADGVHIHPAAVRVAIAAKGRERVCLITDAVSGCVGEVIDGAPRLADGTIAGSVLSMDRAVANTMAFAGVRIEEAVEMASLTPARVLGLDDRKGSLEAGKDADLVLFDDVVNVSLTMIGGEAAWQA